MKRATVSFLFFMLLCFALGADPLARIYQVDDPALQLLEQLSIEAGITPLSSAGPFSGSDLKRQLDRIDPDRLSPIGKEHYFLLCDKVTSAMQVSNQEFEGAVHVTVSPEVYVNTNADAVPGDWFYGHAERQSLLYAEAESLFADRVYGIVSYAVEKKYRTEDYAGGTTNYPFTDNFKEVNLENSLPHTAFTGISGDRFSIVMGRDTLGWGRGNTGNLVLGDHAPYHDFFHVSASNSTLRYTYLVLPMNELDENGCAVIPDEDGTNWNTLFSGSLSRMFIAQRLEADLLPWLRLSLTEGTLFYTDRVDLRMFNPLMILHNYQNFGEVNNTMSLEVEAAVAPGWAVYGQAFLDQFQTADEQQAYEEDTPPNAYAGLLGLEFTKPAGNGRLSGYLEGVYTSPYVYLRKGDHSDDYNLDLVQAVSMRDNESGVSFLGYRYGPDSIVAATHLAYDDDNGFGVFGDMRFIVQGEHGLNIDEKTQQVDPFPSDINMLSPSGDDPTYSLITGFGGKFTLPDTPVRLHGQVHWLNRWNKADGHITDMQIVIGASCTWDLLQ